MNIKTTTNGIGARTASRLAAVQALYQLEIEPITAQIVVGQFISHRFKDPDLMPEKVDKNLFSKIVEGVHSDTEQLDRLISSVLTEDWRIERLETVIKSILRAATYELLGNTNVPQPVIINEYVNITKAFYSGQEPSFINASLDSIIKQVSR